MVTFLHFFLLCLYYLCGCSVYEFFLISVRFISVFLFFFFRNVEFGHAHVDPHFFFGGWEEGEV